jgi:RNA polymerase sigma factor (TIGR02999 family)
MAETRIQFGPAMPDDTVAMVERELRALARMHFARERADHTLQPTAIVNEVWLKLAARGDCGFPNLTAFLAWVSPAIRKILVDHARRKKAAKRGGGWTRDGLAVQVSERHRVDVVELDDALKSLAKQHPRAARIVEMRFFGGMRMHEAADALDICVRQAGKEWATARSRLYELLIGDGSDDDERG